MVSRRDFFRGMGTIAVVQLVSGCAQESNDLEVLLLQNSLPAQLVKQFRNEFSPQKIEVKLQAQLEDGLKKLQKFQQIPEKPADTNIFTDIFAFLFPKKSEKYHLVSMGDYWLKEAIAQQLIQPLSVEQLPGWKTLPKPWQDLVRRDRLGNPTPTGQIWGAPYRWGTTMIAYDVEKFNSLGWQPTDWCDLWRSELKRRISILDEPREVIGLTLKKLGHSYNTQDLNNITKLKSDLESLHQQIKFYSSNKYLEPLIFGDTWLAVGWSTDILPLLPTYKGKIKAVIPQSGTALWSDVWVKPNQKTNNSDLSNQWIDFCWQPQAAKQISLYTNGIAPGIITMKKEEIPQDVLDNDTLLPALKIIDNSEFIFNLPPEVNQQYLNLWKQIRQPQTPQ